MDLNMDLKHKFSQIIIALYKQIGILCGFFPFLVDSISRQVVFGPITMIRRANLAILCQIILLFIQLCLDKDVTNQVNNLTDPNTLVTFLARITFNLMMLSIFFTGCFRRQEILKCLNKFRELKTYEKSINANFSTFNAYQCGLWIKFVFDQFMMLILTISVLIAVAPNEKPYVKIYRAIYFLISMPIYNFVSSIFYSSLLNSGYFIRHIMNHSKNVLLHSNNSFNENFSRLNLFKHKRAEEIDILSKFYEKTLDFSRKIGELFQYILIFCYGSLFLGLVCTVSHLLNHPSKKVLYLEMDHLV